MKVSFRSIIPGILVQPKTKKDSRVSDVQGTYILEKKGKNTTIRKMK